MCDWTTCMRPREDAGLLAIEILRAARGIGKDFIVLGEREKKIIAGLREKENVMNYGICAALLREITIAFSHNEKFRPPPCAIVLLSCNGKIVGEMTDAGKIYYNGTRKFDSFILPAVPFPELEGEFHDVCSASPGYEADRFLRGLIDVEKNDATLLVGFNVTG